MDIKGKVHCLFEQSGTFKNEFKKLGFTAYDYDIQNEFNETDFVIDIFAEISKAYNGGGSMFDKMTEDDLLMAFFPCIYFEAMQSSYYSLDTNNLRGKTTTERIRIVVERSQKRQRFYELLYMLVWVAYDKDLRLIIENPATKPHYLFHTQNFIAPTLIDNNRMMRGDFFKKPTAYWFINCVNTFGATEQNDKEQKIIQKCEGSNGKVCSKERSLMSPDYARNFICDYIIGKEQSKNKGLFIIDEE